MPRDNFCLSLVSQLPSPRVNFERGSKALVMWGRDSLGGILGDNLGEGNCESKIASRQWGDNSCRETSICLAGHSGKGIKRVRWATAGAKNQSGHVKSGLLEGLLNLLRTLPSNAVLPYDSLGVHPIRRVPADLRVLTFAVNLVICAVQCRFPNSRSGKNFAESCSGLFM